VVAIILVGSGVGLFGKVVLNVGNVALLRALLNNDPFSARVVERWLGLAVEGRATGTFRSLTRLWLAEGQTAQAIAAGQQAIAIQSDDSLSAYWLGQSHWDVGQKDAARRVWRATGVIQGRLNYLVWLCWRHVGQGNLGAAEATLREAIDLDPEYSPAYDALASILWGQQETRGEEIVWALERAIAYLPPDTAAWYWNKGRLHLLRGEWAQAAQALRASVALAPSEWPMRFLADALERSGDLQEAGRVRVEIQKHWGGD
jgi:tetratricopeptide (TPR) repeat protein